VREGPQGVARGAWLNYMGGCKRPGKLTLRLAHLSSLTGIARSDAGDRQKNKNSAATFFPCWLIQIANIHHRGHSMHPKHSEGCEYVHVRVHWPKTITGCIRPGHVPRGWVLERRGGVRLQWGCPSASESLSGAMPSRNHRSFMSPT